MSATIADLIARLEKATGPSEELDANIVAHLNGLTVKRYPPTDDFGPKDRWQFWDRERFLGSEHRFPVPKYTASIDVALMLVPEGWELRTLSFPKKAWPRYSLEIFPPAGHLAWQGGAIYSDGISGALAIAGAALKARAALAKDAP